MGLFNATEFDFSFQEISQSDLNLTHDQGIWHTSTIYMIDIRTYATASRKPPRIQFLCEEPSGEFSEGGSDGDVSFKIVGPL